MAEHYAALHRKEVLDYKHSHKPSSFLYSDVNGHVREKTEQHLPDWASTHSDSCWCTLFPETEQEESP